MKRKKKKKKSIPCFVFSPETIALTQEAVQRFEEPSQRTEGQSAVLAFAAATIQRIKDKLDTLSASVGGIHPVTFDYNEKVVIGMAIQYSLFELRSTPADAQRVRKLQLCQQIEHFALDHLELGKERPHGE